ncbi:MAG: hypothetical protein IT450_02670 [Phycisphaerales bacterium]|nr:hypothetical protein [Phycisphaerales bacterium]
MRCPAPACAMTARSTLRTLSVCLFALPLLAAGAAAQQLPPVAATQPTSRPDTPATAPATSSRPEALRKVETPTTTPVPSVVVEEDVATWLEVTTDRVNLRALSGDTNSVRVGQVNTGTFLWAVKKRNDWYAVLPPDGVLSMIEATFVEREGDRAVIKTADAASSVNVRPADMNPAADPLVGYPQTKLQRGDAVTIVGERTSTDKQTGETRTWYTIVPPEGVVVHISGAYVREVTEAHALERGAKKPAGTAVAAAGAGAGAGTGAGGDGAKPAEPESWLKKLKLAEAAIDAENRKPNERQDWATIIALLEPIAGQEQDQHAAAAAAQWIERLNELVEAVAAATTRPADERPAVVTINEERTGFDAEGILKPSVKVPAGEFGLRYGLFRPGTHFVTAYVEFPRELKFNAVENVGRYVGIQGVKYKEGKVDVYRVTKVTVSQVPATPKR